MKKMLMLFVVIATMLVFTQPVFAADVDDGTLQVAERNGVKYFGVVTNMNFIKYEAADGSNKEFYDLNDDKEMDVCDLVALNKNEIDINSDSELEGTDAYLIRFLIINGRF